MKPFTSDKIAYIQRKRSEKLANESSKKQLTETLQAYSPAALKL